MSTNVSGKSGKVLVGASQVASITEWSLDKEAHISTYYSSDGGGFQQAVVGALKASGTISFELDVSAAMGIVEGTSATLKLYVDATHFWSVPAVLKNFKVSTKLIGDVVGGSADWESNGTYVEPTWG